jgi:hypothetical protein
LGWLPGKTDMNMMEKMIKRKKIVSLIYWQTYVEAIHIMTKALVDNK